MEKPLTKRLRQWLQLAATRHRAKVQLASYTVAATLALLAAFGPEYVDGRDLELGILLAVLFIFNKALK